MEYILFVVLVMFWVFCVWFSFKSIKKINDPKYKAIYREHYNTFIKDRSHSAAAQAAHELARLDYVLKNKGA